MIGLPVGGGRLALGRLLRPLTSLLVWSTGMASEVRVGQENGLERESVVNCDTIATIPAADVGQLTDAQEQALTAAIHAAFDLR